MRRRGIGGGPESIFLVCLTFAIVTAAACSRTSPAEKVAWRFVDTYYVRIDPQGALALTASDAHAKLEKELQRLAGVGPVDADDRPQIRAALRERRIKEGGAAFAFEIQSISDGVRQLTVDIYVMKRGGKWVVTDFVERAHT